jgi:TetR/AcrR family transcriptional repressor of lmrAB and yxaGH operons
MPRASDSRARLIDAAARLLWSQGFHATGLNQIVDESGAPKGSLYFHFPGGKEQLCVEALRASGERLTSAIERSFAAQDDPAIAIRDLARGMARHLERSEFREGCPAATVALEAASESEALRTVCDELFARWRELIAEKLRSSGVPRTHAAALATLVLSAIEGGLILSRAQRSVAPLRSVAAQIAEIVAAPRARASAEQA